MRGVIFLVDHLVADQCPARSLGHFNIQALLAVKAQRVRHDEWRGAGDGNETDLEIGLFQRIFVLRHGLHRAHRQHAGNRCHGGALAHRTQEAAAHCVLREDGLDQRGLNERVAVGLEVTREAAAFELDGSAGRRKPLELLLPVIGLGVVCATTAFEHQRAVGVVGGKVFGRGIVHGVTSQGWMRATMQRPGQFGALCSLCGQFAPELTSSCRASPTNQAGIQMPGGLRLCRSAYRASSTSFLVPVFSRMRAR